jgi:hypothetical protein
MAAIFVLRVAKWARAADGRECAAEREASHETKHAKRAASAVAARCEGKRITIRKPKQYQPAQSALIEHGADVWGLKACQAGATGAQSSSAEKCSMGVDSFIIILWF